MRNTDESKTERRTNTALVTVLVLLAVTGLIALWYWRS
jgi:hypothetical protein